MEPYGMALVSFFFTALVNMNMDCTCTYIIYIYNDYMMIKMEKSRT